MNFDFDLRQISRIFFTLVIGFAVGYMFYAMVSAQAANRDKQAEKIKEIIDKALVQCYALEGSYPGDLDHLEKYGVVFQKDKFFYYYEPMFSNSLPPVTVISID